MNEGNDPMGATNTAPARSLAELRAFGKATAKQAGGQTVQEFFEANKPAIASVLPSHMTPERMLKIALGAIRTTPKLQECTLQSLLGAVVVAAQLGLEPNTPQGHLYFIPFSGQVQIVVGYKGLIELARRSGQIESINARVVYSGDDFDVEYGTADRIVHKPKLDGERGPAIGFYAVAKLKGGGTQFEFMSASDVKKIRDNSQGYKASIRYNKTDNPWQTNFDEMARKTVVRRLTKYLPMSIELARAAVLDERAEAGEVQDLGRVLDGAEYGVLDADAPEAAPEPTAEVVPIQAGGDMAEVPA